MVHRIGVISDTHRLMRPEALAGLVGVEHIIHAGDIGAQAVIDALRQIAPVTAIRGNVDTGDWARQFPGTAVVESVGALIYVIHNVREMDLDPRAAGFTAVIYGHSHNPAQENRDGVLYFNPGSAGPRRFYLPVSIGHLTVENGRISGEIIHLPV